MKQTLSLIFGICFIFQIYAQHTIGISTIGSNSFFSGHSNIGSWQADTYDNRISSGYGFGVYHKYQLIKWLYIKSGIGILTENGVSIRLITFDYADFVSMPYLHHAGSGITRLVLPVQLGFQKKYENLSVRFFANISPSMFIVNNSINRWRAPYQVVNRSIDKSFEKLLLDNGFGLGIDFWRFSLDLSYERSLTPIIEKVNYLGKDYSFKLTANRFFLTLGFKLIDIKKKAE